MPDNTETEEHACTSDEQRPSPERAEWGTLLDGTRLIIAQAPDGERLSRLVPDERNLAFLHRNKYAEPREALEHAVSKLTEWLKKGLVESEGFHEDTGTRSSVTQREWQIRVVEIWKNRLINPLRGTRQTYPWITDIEINLKNVIEISQEPIGNVSQPIATGNVDDTPASEKFDRKEAARYLTTRGHRISPQTLANLAANNNAGGGPGFTHVGKHAFYDRRDLDAWFDQRHT
jgi:hypothetical protein